MRYRAKPTTIEAEQWFPGKDLPGVLWENGVSMVRTAHGDLIALEPGDYVIEEPLAPGRHYPCKRFVFERRWEPCDTTPNANAAPGSP